MSIWIDLLKAVFGLGDNRATARGRKRKQRRGYSKRDGPKKFHARKPKSTTGLHRDGWGLTKQRRQSGSQSRRHTVVAFHGTPSEQNAKSILKDGWICGTGNVCGDGIYFGADVSAAKSYAGTSGVYLKCSLKMGRTCNWNNTVQQRFDAWCRKKGVGADNSAKTAFLLQNKFDTLRNGKVVVVLTPGYRNPTAWKRKLRRIRILSIHRASDDRRIRV